MEYIEMTELRKSILTWMAENEWLNENPKSHDFSFDYFYNFFKQKYNNLRERNFDIALWALDQDGYIEVSSHPLTAKVMIIRGITEKGMRFYKDNLK